MRRHLVWLPAVLSSLLWLAACSDDDSPPDDENDGGADSSAGEGGSTQAGSSAGGSPTTGGSRPMGGTAGSKNEGDAGSEVGGNGGASPGGELRGACDIDKRVGRFLVERQVTFGVVTGTVSEGVVPTSIPELVAEKDGCKVNKRRNLYCSPACVGAEVCGEDGSCIPYPRQISVGTVTIDGLTKPTIMNPPTNPKQAVMYFAPGADNPPFEIGSNIVLSAAGTEEHSAFELFGIGSEPLVEGPTWVLKEGQDLALEWPAPSDDAIPTSVFVELTIDQHGNSPLSLSCVLDDTGTGSIPAELIDQLINSGVSGFPNGRIARRTVDKVELDVGCVELVVGSGFSASVSVSGFTPCMKPADCPEGQTCNLQLERCE
jgi:hypothetical protein